MLANGCQVSNIHGCCLLTTCWQDGCNCAVPADEAKSLDEEEDFSSDQAFVSSATVYSIAIGMASAAIVFVIGYVFWYYKRHQQIHGAVLVMTEEPAIVPSP